MQIETCHVPSKVHLKPERHQPRKIHIKVIYVTASLLKSIENARTMRIGGTPVIHVGSIKARVQSTGAVSRLSRRKLGGKNEPAASQRQGVKGIPWYPLMRAARRSSANDPRSTQKGRASAWLIKARSDGSSAKWFQSMGRRWGHGRPWLRRIL